MSPKTLLTRASLLILLTSGCRNAPIDDGAQFGPFTQVKTFFTSTFAAETSEGVVLVDAGFSVKAKEVEKHLEDRGLTLSDVRHVVVTHGHADHVRGLEAFPNARVWAHVDEVPLIDEELEGAVAVSDTFEDGDLLQIGDLELEVFHVPGHTAGNITLLAEGVLLTGDTAMSFKDGTVGPPPERYSLDPTEAADALMGLRDRLEPRKDDINAIVFAHSEGLRDLTPFWEM